MKYFKRIYLSFLLLPMMLLSQTKATVTVQNNSELTRNEAVIAIKWETVLAQFPQIDTVNFVVVNSVTKKQIPFQLEHKGLKTVQNLLLQVNVKAKTNLVLYIQKGKPEAFPTKTFSRFVPERFDDFAWENDKIAFRAYGKALEKEKDNAYGLDVWVKRTDKMVVNERYKLGEYHVDHGNGLDYYKVGFTLGAGDMAPYIKENVRYADNYHRWKILDNGPLRTTFQLEYDAWDADGIKVSCIKTFSLDAGSQLNRIENVYTYSYSKPLPVAVGIAKRPEQGVISLNEQKGILGYWEPAHGNDGTTGIGSILMTPVKNMLVGNDQILAITETKNNEPIVYYTGAAWDKAAQIKNATEWFAYLNRFSEELKSPLLVTVK